MTLPGWAETLSNNGSADGVKPAVEALLLTELSRSSLCKGGWYSCSSGLPRASDGGGGYWVGEDGALGLLDFTWLQEGALQGLPHPLSLISY